MIDNFIISVNLSVWVVVLCAWSYNRGYRHGADMVEKIFTEEL